MLGYVYAVLAAVLWGLIYAIRQKTLPFISPAGMIFVGAIVTLICVTPLMIMDRHHLNTLSKASWSDVGLVIFAAFCAMVGTWMMMVSIDKLNASVAAMVEISYPLFVVLFCWLFFGSAISWPVALGGFLIFCGSAVILIFGRN